MLERIALLVVFSFAASSSAALAARRPKPAIEPLGSALRGEAKKEYEQASALFRTGDYAGALRRYQRAHELQDDPRLLWNMAVSEKQLRHYAKALPYVLEFIAKAAAMIGAEERETAIQFERAIREQIGEITFECREPEVAIFVDEEAIDAACERPIFLDGGTHRVRVTKPDFEELGIRIEVPSGGAQKVTLALEPQHKRARLIVSAAPGQEIRVDGQVVGLQSWSGVLPAGSHAVVVTAPEKVPYQRTVVLQDGDEQNLIVTLEPEPGGGLPAWVWIAGGAVIVAGLAVGGYFVLRPADATIDGTLGSHALP